MRNRVFMAFTSHRRSSIHSRIVAAILFCCATSIVNSAAASVVSDDFQASVLDTGLWSFIDPLGDGALSLTGTQLELTAPAGAIHDIWTNGSIVPRVMQAADDTDFEIEVKFESALNSGAYFQSQGVLIEADEDDLLRLEFHVYQGAMKLYAASFMGGVPQTRIFQSISIGVPNYLRVTRVGDQWTLEYSSDGETWTSGGSFTHALTVTAVGVYAGGGENESHTAVVDYVFDTAATIMPEDGGATNGPHTLTVEVEGSGSVTQSPDAASYASGTAVTLTATPDLGAQFVGWSGAVMGTTPLTAVRLTGDLAVTASFAGAGGGADITPPVISGVQVQAGENGATVSWTTDEPATSAVEFGETSSYGTSESDGALLTNHGVTITGLQPGTEYHYRISSLDGAGNGSSTIDATFLTLSGGNSVSAFISDDFQASGVNVGLWTFIDPLGDGTLSLTGTQLELTAPAGAIHDIWTNGSMVPRVMQVASDTDFQLEVKFESELTIGGDFKSQGVLVEADADDLLRLEFHAAGGSVKLYAASFMGGVPQTRIFQSISIGVPNYLRVTRVGDQWTLEYSSDGETWTSGGSFTHALTVTAVGVYAGSGENAPHTAVVDYLFDNAAPIIPEDGGASSGPHALTVQIEGDGSVTRDPDAGGYASGTEVTLTATPLAGAQFLGWSGAVMGGTPSTTVRLNGDLEARATFTDITPPEITGVQVQAGETSATVSWTSDEPATSEVAYGETTGHGFNASDRALVTTHSVQLTSLQPGTLYHFQVTSVDSAGNGATTADAIFLTTTQGILSDDFQASELSTGLWTFINPLGDGTLSLTGTQLQLTAPAGAIHDIWTNGSNVPRVMQAANDTDFELEVKFESALTGGEDFKSQGILVEADADDLLRLEFHTTGGTAKLYAASFMGGTPQTRIFQSISIDAPNYLRVTRAGDQWTLDYSSDGEAWTWGGSFTHALAVTAVGVYAGGGENESHTAVVDYVFDMASPVIPEDGGASSGPYALAVQVEGDGSVTRNPDAASYASGTEVTLTATPTAGTQFVGWSGAVIGSTPSTTVRLTGDLAITAIFAPSGGGDITPPLISGVQIQAGETSATVSWTTDEPATSEVAYGETSAYLSGNVSDSGFVTNHSATLTGLQPGTEYHYQVRSADGAGNLGTTIDATFTTASAGSGDTGPSIDLWYGPDHAFGFLGVPQQWVNVLGNVSDPDGIASLSYSLNGGSQQALSIGPDDRRLAFGGDFNVEIDWQDLVDGVNVVTVEAADNLNNTTVQDVIVDFANNVWPASYSIDWDSVTNIQDAVQVVDGKWTITPSGIRTLEVDYDRVLAIGDHEWGDYEITVPITMHGIDPSGFDWPSVSPGFGITFRWTGHTDDPVVCPQPRCGWLPSGAGFWYDAGSDGPLYLDGQADYNVLLDLDVRYFWKMRVETTQSGSLYSVKVWEDSGGEPPTWNLTQLRGSGDVLNGSIVFVAHHVDATFGDVTITPILNSNPPALSDIQAVRGDTSATITWTTNEPATSSVEHGLSEAYEGGAVADSTLTMFHSITLSDLLPGTLYHYQVSSTDADGNLVISQDLVFTTSGGPDLSGIASDDFFAAELDNTVWTYIDPRNDGTLGLTGTQLELTAPAGAVHDIWTTGSLVPRVMQATNDTDFELEVKFESALTTGGDFKSQGILVEADVDDRLRMEFHTSGGGATKLYAASFIGGVPQTQIFQSISIGVPNFLRVTRIGDQWTLAYSSDGLAWTSGGSFSHALAVSSVGVYVGSGDGSPHTAVVDYAFNTVDPIEPEDGSSAP